MHHLHPSRCLSLCYCAAEGLAGWSTTELGAAPPVHYGILVVGVAAVTLGRVTLVPSLGRPTNDAPAKRRALLLRPLCPTPRDAGVSVCPVPAQLLFPSTPARAWLQLPPRCVVGPSLPVRPLATAPPLRSTLPLALRRRRPWRHRRRHHRHCPSPRRLVSARGRGPPMDAHSGPSRPTLRRRRAVLEALRPSQRGARDEASRQPVSGFELVIAYPSVAARRHRHCRCR